MRLALADAFHLGRVQAVDLPAPLALALVLDTPGEGERLGEDTLQALVAVNLAREVADHPPEHRAQAPERPVRPPELLGVGVALGLDERDLADPGIGLAQGDAVRLCEPHQALSRPVHQLGIGRKGDRLLLHGGVEDHLGEVGGLGRAGPGGDGQALLQERQQPLLAEALAPARQ